MAAFYSNGYDPYTITASGTATSNTVTLWYPTEDSALQVPPEPSGPMHGENVRWLERRVNEMRVELN